MLYSSIIRDRMTDRRTDNRVALDHVWVEESGTGTGSTRASSSLAESSPAAKAILQALKGGAVSGSLRESIHVTVSCLKSISV